MVILANQVLQLSLSVQRYTGVLRRKYGCVSSSSNKQLYSGLLAPRQRIHGSSRSTYATKTGKEIIRLATKSDIDGICVLSKLAHKEAYKSDYLPGWLPKVLEDPNRIACVVEKDMKITAFIMGLCGVDEGRTLLGEAARVRPDEDGSGLLGRLNAFLVSMCTKIQPLCERHRASSLHTKFLDKNPDKFQIISSTNYIEAHISAEVLHKSPTFQPALPVSINCNKLFDEDFGQIISDPGISNLLYPRGLIVTSNDVFEATPANVPFITYFHSNIFMSEDQRAISIGGRSPCNDDSSWRYNFNYSGRIDLNTFQVHLAEHLNIYTNEKDGKDIHLSLSVPNSFQNLFGKDAIKYSLHEFLGISEDSIQVRSQYQYQYA